MPPVPGKFLIFLTVMILFSDILAARDMVIIGSTVRDVEKIKRSTGSVEVIEMKERAGKTASVADVLSESAGVQVKRFGSAGSNSHITIRGSNANQVAVFLDGVLLNDTVFGEVNLEDIPLANIERIEIYRGHTPLRFGSTGIGGVVNIVTKKEGVQDKKPVSKTRVLAGYGSFNTIKAIVARYQRIESFYYRLFFDRTSSDGNFIFKDDNGTPVYNTGDDRNVKRKNNDHSAYSANAKAGYDFDSVKLMLINDFYYKEHGIAGLNNNLVDNARFDTKRNLLSINAKIPELFIKNVQSTVKGFYSYRRDVFKDPDDEIGLGGKEQKGFFDAYGGSLFAELALPSLWQTLSLLTSVQRELYHSESAGFDGITVRNPTQKRIKLDVGIEDEFSFFSDRLLFVPSVRYAQWRDDFYIENSPFLSEDGVRNVRKSSKTSWKVGMRFDVYKSKKMYARIKGNISRDYRVPTFTELFGDRGIVLGNPELVPEKALNRDVGFECILKKTGFINNMQFNYSYFNNRIEDIIIFIHNSQNTMIAYNISGALISGHEFGVSGQFAEHIILKANYTWQKPLDKSEISYYRNNYLPHRPVHEALVSVKYKARYAAITYIYSFAGANFRDRANSEFYYVENRMYHDAVLEVFPASGVVVTLEAKNLLNDMTRDRIGYPLPGRSLMGTVEYTF